MKDEEEKFKALEKAVMQADIAAKIYWAVICLVWAIFCFALLFFFFQSHKKKDNKVPTGPGYEITPKK